MPQSRRHLVMLLWYHQLSTAVSETIALESLKMFHIDPEKLINAVKARPSLYDKNNKLYYVYKNQNHIKELLWVEVAEEVLENKDLLLKDKDNFVFEVQKRWRSLRSCFARELAIQRLEDIKRADGKGYIRRRKKYEYFDSLLFLKEEAESSEIKNDKKNSLTELSGNCTYEQVYIYDEFSEDTSEVIKKEPLDLSDYEIKDTQTVIFENNDNLEIVPDTAKKMKREDHDEDEQFALSLVPSLRKLDSKRNLEAKIEILKAIQAVSFQFE